MPDQPRVLIVENSDVLRVMLFTVLRHQPLEVDVASTASVALAKVQECDYALILLDMDLPDHESERFLREFRTVRPEATSYVIAVRDPRHEVEIDPSSVVAVLHKPVEIDILGEIARECAFLAPEPENPLDCSPADSHVRGRLERSSNVPN